VPHPFARNDGGGLAYRGVGHLMLSRGDSGAFERETVGCVDVGGLGVIDAFVDSVRKHAHGPWLCPKHRRFTGTDRRGLERGIRHEDMYRCVAYSNGNEDYVALGWDDGRCICIV
jgi:hypothetical protein